MTKFHETNELNQRQNQRLYDSLNVTNDQKRYRHYKPKSNQIDIGIVPL